MSALHAGNMQPLLDYEEHDGLLNAKKTSLVSAATIYAVVNTGAAGVQNSIVTVANTPLPVSFGGNVTLDAGSKTQIIGNVTLSDPKGFIGLTTAVNGQAWPDPKTYLGLVTIDIGTNNSVAVKGNVTLSDSKGYIGLVTLGGGTAWTDPKAYIGLATVNNATAWPDPKTYLGLVTVDIGTNNNVAVKGNVTISDSKGFIGLVTLGGGTAWADPKTYIGLATVNNATAWPDPKTYIGLATIDIGTNNSVAIKGNVTLSDPKGFIGLVTIGNTANVAVIGNVTLSDSKGFIGLATIVPTFVAGYTSFATVISATGPATIVVPPSNQKIFVRNMHVSSLGRAEMSSWNVNSSATQAQIPWTSLSTTAGFTEFFGESGRQWGKADDGLTFALNGAATVGIGVEVRFAA